MAEAVLLVAETRTESGSQSARKLRRQGKLPAVVYGHGEKTLSLTLSREEVEKAIKHGQRVVDLRADGKEEKALIREVQWDHLGRELLHVDFARVSADERIVVTVPLELRGQAPGVNAGGVLDQPMHTLEIECLALSIPDTIRVTIGELQIGGIIHVRDLALPPGVTALPNPDAIVVHVKAPVAEAEAAPAAEAAEKAEPELIKREKAEEEAE